MSRNFFFSLEESGILDLYPALSCLIWEVLILWYSSGFKGVYWLKERGRWRAQITNDWKKIHLGYFDFLEDAARPYEEAAIELFVEYAGLNFPLDNRKVSELDF